MSVITNNLLLGEDGYQISRSVRLRSSASAYFNRTPASAGNRKTWTWSGWVKRGALSNGTLFDGGSTGPLCVFQFYNDQLRLYVTDSGITTSEIPITTAVFRDPSAWYHVVCAVDTTQATATNRVKIYVNGVQQVVTGLTGSVIGLNGDLGINRAVATYIGEYSYGGSLFYDGYLTEVNFIDGQALTPSSFGETDVLTGVWRPKKYAGTYGTNGFYLNFSDNSNNTAATIGKDYSGNGNNWTPNNISVTAGATYDSMLDVPTMWADGGNGRGNYCTLNPLDFYSGSVSNGNLQWTTSSSVGYGCFGSFAFDIADSTNKYYWEMTITSGDGVFGIVPLTTLPSSTARAGSYSYYTSGSKYSGTSASAYGATFTTGDVIGVAVGAGVITFYKNGTSQGSAFTGLTGFFKPAIWEVSGTFVVNFGQRPFAYTPPTGFKALNTQNLPDATIKKGNQYFDATLYTGNGSTQSIVNSGAFQPDLVWMKSRSSSGHHSLSDAVRGVNKQLFSSLTDAEGTQTDQLTAFNSNGFSLGANAAGTGSVNVSTVTYAAWQWKKGATQGFDIVTYTGDGTTSASRTIAHSLGVKPAFIITKKRSGGTDYGWSCWHKDLGGNYGIWLDKTSARNSGMWGGYSSFSSTVFTPPDKDYGNENGQTYVNYLFAEVAGFSKFGSYTGNGSADGPMVWCGFQPRFIMIKRTDTTSNWVIWDTARDTYNAGGLGLYPNLSAAEDDYRSSNPDDILSNGFKPRANYANVNASGGTYIFAAFASVPFKHSLAR